MATLKFDLHVHTYRSPDAVNTVKHIVNAVDKLGLDGIAITDHDQFDRERTESINREHDFTVIPAQEVTTSIGHVLAYFIDTPIEPAGDVNNVIDQIHDQEGLAVLAHPFRHKISYSGELWERIDGVERLNGRSGDPTDGSTANALTTHSLEGLSIPVTAGSDAHFPWEIGRAVTEVETSGNPDDVQPAIRRGDTDLVMNRATGYWTQFLSKCVWYGRFKGNLF